MDRREFLRRSSIFLAGARTLWAAKPAKAGTPYIVAAAGDIARPSSPSGAQIKTQKLVQSIAPDKVLVLGDSQYLDGELSDYRASYDPTWGKFKSITHPAAGDHDWRVNLNGYYSYWNLARSHYSFNAGGWHFICLDSNKHAGIASSSQQCLWLLNDITATSLPTIAYWARPRFSSGAKHGSLTAVQPFWEILYESGKCKLILNGHEHLYERFAKMAPGGGVDANGIRQITVGTGGSGLVNFSSNIRAGSQYRNSKVHGVLKLLLGSSSYTWRWMNTSGGVLDSGTDGF